MCIRDRVDPLLDLDVHGGVGRDREPVTVMAHAQFPAELQALDLLPVEAEPPGVVVDAPDAVPGVAAVAVAVEQALDLLTQLAGCPRVHEILDLVPVERVQPAGRAQRVPRLAGVLAGERGPVRGDGAPAESTQHVSPSMSAHR